MRRVNGGTLVAGTEPAAVARGRTDDLAPAWGSPGGVPLALMDEGLVASGFGYERFTALAARSAGQTRPDATGSSSGASTAAAANG